MSTSPPVSAVFIDGARREPHEATVSVYDRGFLYGDSVFEVVRTYGGRPFGLGEHVARLFRSADKIGIALPWSEAGLEAEIAENVRAAGFDESYVRVVVTRGVGSLGLDPDLAHTPTRVVLVHPLTLPPVAVFREGVGAWISESIRATDGTAAEGAKASNYLANLLALRDAKAHGCYEPVFVERHGDVPLAQAEVLEGGTSNVFVVEGDVLVTPPDRRILSGITRRYVMACAPSAGLQVRAEPITLERFLRADEAFLTSTIREIVPIVRVVDRDGAQKIGTGEPGARTRALHRAFRTHVGAPTSPMPWERSR